MTNQISTQTISFYGSDLITLKVEDVIYTAVKPIAEALGLAWGTQQQKLSRSKDKFGCIHMNTPTNGGMQSMLCMPLKKLNGWLFSINPEKVRPDLRDRVIQYQEECFEALYNYWHFGKAERKTTTDERTGLRQAVSALVSKKGLLYSDAYTLIHQRFNIDHIDELTPEQVGMAVEYVHKIYLEGELIIDEPKHNIVTPSDETLRIAKYLVRARAFAKEVEAFHRKLYEDLGIPRYVRNDIAGKAYDIAHEFNVWIDPFIEKTLPQLNQQRLARF
ncbi:phage antirepressor N-terminal domain-containing protein [Glaesserella parasuis]|uniref:phage antirepressor N-terminal domain-containing protein n=1 Tax=Glaesserella parasuis TaxID=738 RepID=UPI00095012D0|nr:phage antirepressor N-terminal domain-containing protein [Glaesserella parasuis]MDG6829082.1 phage antirepressor N-terminal domain-containing protein [Glaesserella parasuis]MWQ13743.1 hypothetical protein [Glaesserella parasuis]QKJ69813.1 phage antirepressor N-terminal domain-containing protein [Glaesserella parasuis]